MNPVANKTKAEKKARNKSVVPGFTTRRDVRRPPIKSKILNQETESTADLAGDNESVSPTHDRTIRDDESLSTEDFMERLRISYPTYREMLDNGLPVRTQGRYRRISGREFNRWAETWPLLRPDAVKKTTKA